MILAADYGPFDSLVSGAGSLIAAAAAVGLTWRGRTNWEPSEEDVAKGPQKVGGLPAAVALVVLWAKTQASSDDGYLVPLAITLAILCLFFLLAYGFVIATQTFDVEVAVDEKSTKTRKVIGGFWLTPRAKAEKKERNLTTQELLRGSEYDVDKVWTRGARALAKSTFVLCYIGLTVTGTIALASGAMLLG